MGLQPDTPLQFVKGVGPRRAEAFARLGLRSVGDLLHHFPHRYEIEQGLVEIADLEADRIATIRAEVQRVHFKPSSYVADVADESGVCTLRWFNLPRPPRGVGPGVIALISGRVKEFDGEYQIVNPTVRVLKSDGRPDSPVPEAPTAGLAAVYPSTADLSSGQIRRTVGMVLGEEPELPDVLPEALRKRRELDPRSDAIRTIHRPMNDAAARQARRRLAYEELFLMELGLALRRRKAQVGPKAAPLKFTPEIDQRIRARFPFTLTQAQDAAVREIVADLQRDRPMNRLLQGDVGSGKTVVALYAALVAVANRRQAAILAPTEILARQHADRVEQYLAGSRVRRTVLIGALSAPERRERLAAMDSGEIDLVIGTHALLEESVSFRDLALAVVDEQHKFGVRQRLNIRTKGAAPHYLVMTATPIPRTLAMTAFGDLESTVIQERPPGRGPVRTNVHSHREWERVMRDARRELENGRQAFVVCPAIGQESAEAADEPPAQASGPAPATQVTPAPQRTSNAARGRMTFQRAPQRGGAPRNPYRTAVGDGVRRAPPPAVTAQQIFERLKKGVWKGLDLALLHGRLKPDERQAAIDAFAAGRLHAVVSTTVVEVGVDVPNATLMIVENAERFGLAQLHQLRGRIGRGPHGGRCELIVYTRAQKARERLTVLTQTADGFEIAEEDLRLRGPGELLGTRQHGLPELRIASLVDDLDLLRMARQDAFELVERDPSLSRAEHAGLRQELERVFQAKLGLLDAG